MDDLTRRNFTKASAGALLTAGVFADGVAAAGPAPAAKKRYAIVGVGARAYMYLNAIQKSHAAHAELVAACDLNPGRLEISRKHATDAGRDAPRTYAAADFDKMIAETRPDVVIVTTVDASHDDYLVRAMAAGCDTITEKPMTTDADKCRRILDAGRPGGRRGPGAVQ
jgi:predicted dehydrogenase